MSNHMIYSDVMLVGTGQMAMEYIKVLKYLGVTPDVVGRSKASCERFSMTTQIPVCVGGLNEWQKNAKAVPHSAIVAVGVDQLANVTLKLLRLGVKRILVEKPGGLHANQLKFVAAEAKFREACVYVAYNRRFYASVLETIRMTSADGGITSMHFDFSELSHKIKYINKPD